MKKLLLLAIVALFVINANAQWQYSGLSDKSIYCFATRDTSIFAGTDSGVFLSNNSGNNWIAANNSITKTTVTSLAIINDTVFAGTYHNGVFLSNSKGNSWTSIDKGLTDTSGASISSLVVSGSDILAGTFGGGVFLSTNNGSSWSAVSNGLKKNTYVTNLALSNSGILACASTGLFDGEIFLSSNDGSDWISVDTTMSKVAQVYSLAASGSNILVGTDKGLYMSSNNGNSWALKDNGLTDTFVTSLAISGSDIFAGTFGGGIFLSNNNGSSWTNVSSGLPTGAIIDAFAVNDSIIFAGIMDAVDHYDGIAGVWQQPLSNLTGIRQIPATQTNFELYPNPTSNNFIIQTITNGKQFLQVFDITGKLILSQNIYNSKTTIDASNFADGIYFVSLKGNEGVATEKLVVVR